MAAPLRFNLHRRDGLARRGTVTTLHGSFETPAFMPVGTQASVKGITPDQLLATGAQIVLSNTYHLMLRPGEQIVQQTGGLHRFMAWEGPILTDSGGFQVFSMADINAIDDEKVIFKSHIDGSMIHLTPRRSIEVQNALGADIIMAFDQCPPADAPLNEKKKAVERTILWASRCREAHQRPDEQSLFGIVQGGDDRLLRELCAKALLSLDFPGYAIGGLAVGEGFEAMCRTIGFTAPLLPEDRPRYLMGVGYPRDIVAAVAQGVDMFDCVLPTRNGRNAYAFTPEGPLRLRNSRFAADPLPISQDCDCYACRHFSRSALRHYFFASEMLGPILVSVHNIRFFQRLMLDIRQAVGDGTLGIFQREDRRCLLGPPADDDTLKETL